MGKKYLDTKNNSLESSVLGVWETAIEEGEAIRDAAQMTKEVTKEEVELKEKPAGFIRLSFNSSADVNKARKWMDQNLLPFSSMTPSQKDIEFEDVDDAEGLMAKLKKAGFKFKVDHREEVELPNMRVELPNMRDALMKIRTEKHDTHVDEGYVNIGGAKVKDDEKSILKHIQKTFPNVKKVKKDSRYGWIPVFEEVDLDEGIKVGDNVHLGFGAKGGTGFKGKVIKIDRNNVHIKNPEGKEYKGSMKFVTKEETELDEATKWKMGDGRPRGGSHIENVRFWDLPKSQLDYIRKDAYDAMKANPTARKAGKWADEVNDAETVLSWRKKNGIKEEVEKKETILERIDRKLKEKKEILEASNRWELAGKKFSLINDKGTFILVPQGRPGKEQKLKAKTSQDATQELVKKGYRES